MKKVNLQPIEDSLLVKTGSFLLPALLAKDLQIPMSCGGNGICATCHVRVRSGMDELSPMEAKERRTLSMVADADACSRLACQTRVHGEGVEVELPSGMYIERAEDLLSLLGTRAPENILHPIRGHVLIPKGKIITRTLLEQSRSLDEEVRRMKDGLTGRSDTTSGGTSKTFTASGSGVIPISSTSRSSTARTMHSQSVQASRSDPFLELSPAAPAAPVTPSESIVSPKKTPSVEVEINRPTTTSIDSTPRRNDSSPATGARIGKCLLMDRIGAGGAGQVYRALHTTLNIPVAVKFLTKPTQVESDAILHRFRTEARLLAQLNHPNVVRVLDFEDDAALPYVVMEYVEGLSVAELIQQSGRIQTEKTLKLVNHVINGLEAAQRLGIVHRDVKPGNIIVGRDGMAKLVDLGLAVQMGGANSSGGRLRKGILEGSVAYISPEQATDPASVDHRSDIYSLGVTLFHMVTGKLPFKGRSLTEMIYQHLQTPAPSAHEFAPDVPPVLSTIIHKMLAKHPAERHATYQELRVELAEVLQEALI